VKAGTKEKGLNLIDVGSRGNLALSHIFIDNTGVGGEHTGIAPNGDGVTSFAVMKGVKVAVKTSKTHSLDHVTADGELDVGPGSYVTLSKFANLDAEKRTGFFEGGSKFTDVSAKAGVQALDSTPPPAVVGVKTAPGADGKIKVSWTAVTDPESGVAEYAIFAGDQEIARTAVGYEPPENFHSPFVKMLPATSLEVAAPAGAKLAVKAINGAGLLSGGGLAGPRTWAPVRGQFFKNDGSEVVLSPEVKVSASGNPGQPVTITLPDGSTLDSEKDLKNKANPSRILLPAGKPVADQFESR
jgi:hypothetical protein